MRLFISFFKCGKVIVRNNNYLSRCDYYVQNLNLIINNIIPHFDKYPLKNITNLDFIDFKLIMEMINKKEHKN